MDLKNEDIRKMRQCAPLLPPPGDEVVAQLCDRLEELEAERDRWRNVVAHAGVEAEYRKYVVLQVDPEDWEEARREQ